MRNRFTQKAQNVLNYSIRFANEGRIKLYALELQ